MWPTLLHPSQVWEVYPVSTPPSNPSPPSFPSSPSSSSHYSDALESLDADINDDSLFTPDQPEDPSIKAMKEPLSQ